jgi:Mor family transcriptional regulator
VADRDLIDAVLEEVYQALLRPPMDDLDAIVEAQHRVESLQDQFGGRRHYWPKPDKEPRNIRIAADLHATQDAKALAAKHGVHVSTIKRAAKRADPGDDGFGNPDWNLK